MTGHRNTRRSLAGLWLLVGFFGGVGLLKLDKHSNLMWAYRGACHHQAFVTADGTIYVLTMRARIIRRINPDQPIVEDTVTTLDPDGHVLTQVSLLECFENSTYRDLLDDL